jgi:hypothetical protein
VVEALVAASYVHCNSHVHNDKPQQKITHLASIPQQMMRITQQNSHPYSSVGCTTGKAKEFHQIYLDYLKIFACVRWSFG